MAVLQQDNTDSWKFKFLTYEEEDTNLHQYILRSFLSFRLSNSTKCNKQITNHNVVW